MHIEVKFQIDNIFIFGSVLDSRLLPRTNETIIFKKNGLILKRKVKNVQVDETAIISLEPLHDDFLKYEKVSLNDVKALSHEFLVVACEDEISRLKGPLEERPNIGDYLEWHENPIVEISHSFVKDNYSCETMYILYEEVGFSTPYYDNPLVKQLSKSFDILKEALLSLSAPPSDVHKPIRHLIKTNSYEIDVLLREELHSTDFKIFQIIFEYLDSLEEFDSTTLVIQFNDILMWHKAVIGSPYTLDDLQKSVGRFIKLRLLLTNESDNPLSIRISENEVHNLETLSFNLISSAYYEYPDDDEENEISHKDALIRLDFSSFLISEGFNSLANELEDNYSVKSN